MRITTVGPLALDDRPVPGSRLASLVRLLATTGGRPVGTARLVEVLWPEEAPTDPAGALQALVSRARRLGLAVTAVGSAGYRLELDGVQVDVLDAAERLARARTALHDGRVDDARAAAGAGIAALLGAVDPAAVGAALGSDPDTDRLLAGLVEIEVEATLALGEAPEDLGLLRALALGTTPPDERLAALLLRALAAQGRPGEAAAVFDQVRAALADLLGTDPGPALAGAHLALLRGELEPAGADPPAHAVEQPPAAGPTPPTRPASGLVGRDDELAAIEGLLRTAPVVTLVAPGGAGKTTLATEVAGRAAARGLTVHLVELAALRDGGEVLATLLTAVGAPEASPAAERRPALRTLTPAERLRAAAEQLTGLLVIDNCEHLLDAAADVVARLVAAARPDLRVLTTSRAPLAVPGEHVHRVSTLSEDDAVALLQTRARAARPDLAWDDSAARELCRRLDHLPLAIELAAARLRSMPLADVLAGVTERAQRFALLDHALRGLPDRHAGLWATVDWSWGLLAPADQALLRDLAVVPAAFPPDAAEAIAPDLSPAAVRRGLGALVEQSLLILEDAEDGARYRMLETVREYGEALLADAGGRDGAMGRLTRWAADRAQAHLTGFASPRQVESLAATAREAETFMAALRWANAKEAVDLAFPVAGALQLLAAVRGMHVESASISREILAVDRPERRAALRRLAVPDAADLRDGASAPAPDVVGTVAIASVINGGANRDLRIAAAAVLLGRRVRALRGDALSVELAAFLKALALLTERWREGVEHGFEGAYEAIATELIESPSVHAGAIGHLLLAVTQDNLGETADASRHAELAYARFAEVGNEWALGQTAQALGSWMVGRGAGTAGADAWLGRAQRHLGRVGATQDVRQIGLLRDLYRASGGDPAAVQALHEAHERPSADPEVTIRAAVGLGGLALADGRDEEAAVLAGRASQLVRTTPSVVAQARAIYLACAALLDPRRTEDLADATAAALGAHDGPVLGTVAFAHSARAAAEGDVPAAVTLWALGHRLGGNVANSLGPRAAGLLEEVGEPAAREAALERARAMTAAETWDRLVALVTARAGLTPDAGRPTAPGA